MIQATLDQPSYASEQVREIAENLVLFQRQDGGWPKDYDMAAVLTEEQKAAVKETRGCSDSSYDNGNLHAQVAYLARAYAQGEEEGSVAGGLRARLDFILASQYANGGFPQRFSKPKDLHAHITFNDLVMIGNMRVLQDIAAGEPCFAWLDDQHRERAKDGVRRGIDCILKCQIRVEGKLVGWCQQHDEVTYELVRGGRLSWSPFAPKTPRKSCDFSSARRRQARR